MSTKLDLTEINNRLEKNLEDLFKNDRFQNMLDVMASGHHYSINNVLLIAAQKPEATMVRGFKQWQALGRHVNKGEKSIDILVPSFKKVEVQKINEQTGEILRDANGDPQSEVRQSISGFVMGKVFDVSQTDGKDIPSVRDFIQEDLKSADSLTELYQRFVDSINHNQQAPLHIREEAHTAEGYGGYYNRQSEEIVINTAVSKTTEQKFSVLIHEYAHSQLHHKENDMKDLPRGHKEAQAECVAYIVSQYYGLDTSLSSTGYIASWAKDLDLAKQAIKEVQTVSQHTIEKVNSLQSEKINEFYQSINPEQVKSALEEKHQISLTDNPTLQLLDAKNGLVIYATVEQNERDQQFVLRTNTNRFVPLNEVGERYPVLNVLENKGQLVKEYTKVEDLLKVTKIEDGKYAVTLEGGESSQRTFTKKAEGQQFLQKTALAQSLNTDRFLSRSTHKEATQLQQVNAAHLNERIGAVLKVKNNHAQHQHNVTLGWHLLKHPQIQSKDELQQHISGLNPNQSHTKEMGAAFKQLIAPEKTAYKQNELER
ncbi:ArdC-like ssDNA-binding domain-containing protein [Planococcus donghaensis]|uniref:ArdC-like ssDNA-binding domain-containing protein n=1 Tax=Planococcus donghaensis TaxID=414778 RepID=UPI0037356EC7